MRDSGICFTHLSTETIHRSKKRLPFPLPVGEGPGNSIEYVTRRIREQRGNKRELLVLNQFEHL